MSLSKIRATLENGFTVIRVLVEHPMESGRRKGEGSTALVPRYLTGVRIERQGRLLVEARLSPGVSKNPYIGLRVRGGQQGDRIKVVWVDTQHAVNSLETTVD